MRKGRATTQKERIEMVSYCIEHGMDYALVVEKYGVSQPVKEHSTRLSRNSINYATVEKVSKKAEKVRAIPAPCC